MIEQDKINEIIEKTDIVSLVGQYVQLTKAGSDYKGLCPFHNEKTPSFMVSPSKKIAKCMGCGKGGNPITFLKEIKNLSFEEACIELAEKANISLNIKKKEVGPDYSKYYKIMEEAAKFYHFNLVSTKSGLDAIKYLEKRGLTLDIINEFNIGLAPNKSDALYLTLKDLNYNEIDMIECGLIKESERNNSFFDLFKNRIMFPVTDKDSHIIAFSGRIFNGETDQAKYINSPETPIFKKNTSIYHLDLARPFILKNKRVILHEGQMDVIASSKSGLGEAVCSMGTALTTNQAKLLRTFTENIIVCYDGDSAGVNAMVKAIKLLKAENFNISLVRLPDGMDPDEYVLKYGKEEYLKYFNSHIEDPNDYLYEYITSGAKDGSLDLIEQIKNKLFAYLKNLNSRSLVEGYLHRFSDSTGISFASLILDYNGFINRNGFVIDSKPKEITSANVRKVHINEFSDKDWYDMLSRQKSEIKLIRYAMKAKSIAIELDQKKEGNIILTQTFDQAHANLWETIVNDYYLSNDEFNEGIFLKYLDKSQYNCFIGDKKTVINLNDETLSDDKFYTTDDLKQCVYTLFRNYFWKQIIDLEKEYFSTIDEVKKTEIISKKMKVLQQKNLLEKKHKDKNIIK